jgi:hypothetical protein
MPIIIEPTEQEKKFIAEHCVAVNGLMDFIMTSEPTEEHINGPYKIRKFRLADGVFLHYAGTKELDPKEALKMKFYTQMAVFNMEPNSLDKNASINAQGKLITTPSYPNLSFAGHGNGEMQFTRVKGNLGFKGWKFDEHLPDELQEYSINFIDNFFVEDSEGIRPSILHIGDYYKFEEDVPKYVPVKISDTSDYWGILGTAASMIKGDNGEIPIVKAYKSAATGKQ